MKYGLTALTQVSNFLSAAGLGLLLCVLYYVIAFVRSSVSERKTAYFISDMLFSVLSAFGFFVFFQVYTYGEVRVELIMSAVFSFFVYRFFFRTLFSGVFRKGVTMFSAFLKAFFFPFTSLSYGIRKLIKKNNKKEK